MAAGMKKIGKSAHAVLNENDFMDWVKRQIELFKELDNEDKLLFFIVFLDRLVSRIEMTKNLEHYKKVKQLVDDLLPEISNVSDFAKKFINTRVSVVDEIIIKELSQYC